VAARAIVLAALCYRAELEGDPDAETFRRKLLWWLDALPLGNELELGERGLLETSVGDADQQAIINAHWRSEGLAVLAWALQRFKLPPYDQVVDRSRAAARIGFSEDLLCERDTSIAEGFLQSAALRPAAEISRFTSHITIVHWRLKQFTLGRDSAVYADIRQELKDARRTGVQERMDFAGYLRRHPMFKEYWLDGLRWSDGDLALGEHSIATASAEEVSDRWSIAVERQIAAFWLEGDDRVYSQVSPDTLLAAC
jgi:hypothetical protein